MNNFQNIYFTREYQISNDSLQFYFISQGETNIFKAVQYHYVREFDGRPLFNLGFGDYYIDKNTISDEIVTNNRDHYKVFHTVLATIPRLFDVFGDIILMVQGSDSRPEYIDRCMRSCSKRCNEGICKNADRRINIYTGFIDKHFDALSDVYVFLGAVGIENHKFIEPFQQRKKYKTVFIIRKKF